MDFDYGYSPLFSLPWAWNLVDSNPGDAAIAFVLLGLTLLLLLAIKTWLLGASFQFRRMTLPSLLLDAYLLIMLVPSIFWFLLSSGSIRYVHLIAIDVAPILFLLGVWLANVRFKLTPRVILAFLNGESVPRAEDKLLGKLHTLMLVASIAIAAGYVMTAQFVPLIASVEDYGALSSDDVRLNVYSLPDTLIFAYAVATRFLLPFCVLYSFFMAKLHGKGWRFRFWATLLLSLVVASLSLERSPSFGIFLVLLVADRLTSKKTRLLLSVGVLLVAALFGGLIHQAQYQSDIERADVSSYMGNFLVNRVWIDPSYMTAVAFHTYNASTSFLGGKSIRMLSLVGIPYESFSSIGFVGDLWANFGWTGVIFGCTSLGFVLQWIQGRAFKTKTPAVLVIYILFLVNTPWLLYGSILSTMVVTVFVAGLLLLRILPRLEARMSPLVVRPRRGALQSSEGLPQPSN